MSFGEQLAKALEMREMTQAELCHKSGLKSSYVSQYLNKPDRDPQLSTALRIAQALDVSLNFLAGLEEDPDMFYADPMTMRLVNGFHQLPYKSKQSVLEQVDFQLFKSSQAMSDSPVSGVA